MEYLEFIEPLLKLLLLIAAVVWWLIHTRSASRKLSKELEIAKADLCFLLQVEEEYGIETKLHQGSSLKNVMRQRAKNMGYTWSGKFTRGSINLNKANAAEAPPKSSVMEILK